MNRHSARWLLPAVAVLSLALAGCGDDPADEPGRSESTPSDEYTPTQDDAGQTWTLLSDESENVPLTPGDYGLTANGVSDTIVVVTAPEGFMGFGGWTFVTDSPFRAMGFQTAERVFPDPCSAGGATKRLVDPGPTVKDLARALVSQKGAVTSEPVAVTVGGHRGLYLDYRVAKGIDVKACEGGDFDIFNTGPGTWYLEEPRERAGIWILDVNGERLVLAWVAVPGVSQAQIKEMTDMVRSTRFVESG